MWAALPKWRKVKSLFREKAEKVNSRMVIVREKVTQTSRPNRSLTNSRDLCVCFSECV